MYDFCWIEIPGGPTINLSPAHEQEANAKFILTACNTFYTNQDTIDAQKALIDEMDTALDLVRFCLQGGKSFDQSVVDVINNALANAREQQ